MKAARDYLITICKALAKEDEWYEIGEKYLRMGRQVFLDDIAENCRTLRGLDAQDVKDAILETGNEEDIAWRLKRMDDYKLLPTINYIASTIQDDRCLSDDEVNEAIAKYRQLIEDKVLDLIRVYDECEKYIKPQNPAIIKALADPLLCSYFYDNKEVLKEYTTYCLSEDANIKLKAMRAKELANKGKIKMDYVRKPLHDALKNIGLNVGSYPQWNASINLV